MIKRKARTLFIILLMFCAATLLARQAASDDKPAVMSAGSVKYQNFPGLPNCAQGSVVHGDPGAGGSVILAKFGSGCVVPMHWHTPNEQLMFVSGKGTVEAKGEATQAMNAGSFAYMPSKHPHKFTCQSNCSFYLVSDGAFDIHYVDDSGNEIPVDQALKTSSKK